MTKRYTGCMVGAALGLLTISVGAQAGNQLWGDPCRSADHERSARIGALYQERGRTPIWVTAEDKTPAGIRLLQLIAAASADGAGSGTYVTHCLQRALHGRDTGISRGQLEVMLTDAYLALAEDLLDDPPTAGQLLEPLGPDADGPSIGRWLDQIASEAGVTVETIGRPATPGERRGADIGPPAASARDLAAALEHYRALRDAGGWKPIGAGPDISPGERDSRVPVLRERLTVTGDLNPGYESTAPSYYDHALRDAVRVFQDRHGLPADGIVDAATQQALDTPVETRINQIRINLQRMRAHEVVTEGQLVRVNIPDFRVELHRNGRIEYATRAVVGSPRRPTPVFDSRMTHLTLNPAWHVPRSIVREELAPRFAEDPEYAERHGFHLMYGDKAIADIDWAGSPDQPVRQEPGPTNALGRLKFEMPNRRAIFLHDTPERHLFRADQRAFSAGCVRVEQPLELASRLAGFDATGPQRLSSAIRSGETRPVRFGRSVPVQIVYFTAWADAEGRVQFREDIYGKDREALAALDEG